MLALEQYQSVLESLGYAQTHLTKYAVEYRLEKTGELVYINRKKASAGLVVSPLFQHAFSDLSAIPGITFSPGANHYKHNSNFRSFPKRINNKTPIGYGLEFQAESEGAASQLLRRVASDSGGTTVLEEIESAAIELSGKSNTERDSMIRARLGQGPWRAGLDSCWGSCALTGCDIREMLRGSHIKPWKDSSDREKLDVDNGLLLRADVDALFDKGLLSFQNNGAVLISGHLTESQQQALPFDLSLNLRNVPEASKHYLEYHRREVFKGAA